MIATIDSSSTAEFLQSPRVAWPRGAHRRVVEIHEEQYRLRLQIAKRPSSKFEGLDDTDELGVEFLGRLKARSSATECANHRESAGIPPGPYRDLRLQAGFNTEGNRRTPASTQALNRSRFALALHRSAVPFHPVRVEPWIQSSFARDARTTTVPVCSNLPPRFLNFGTTAARSVRTSGPLISETPKTFTTSRRSIHASSKSPNPSQSS
jgi:hypothetical protein